MHTVKKSELILRVAVEANQEKDIVAKTIDTMTKIMQEQITSKNKVTLTGFGTFEPKTNNKRNGINPKTGENIVISQSESIKFKVSKQFKDSLN